MHLRRSAFLPSSAFAFAGLYSQDLRDEQRVLCYNVFVEASGDSPLTGAFIDKRAAGSIPQRTSPGDR